MPSSTQRWIVYRVCVTFSEETLGHIQAPKLHLKMKLSFSSLALKYEPTNVRYLWERSSLYEQMGDHKMAMDGYRRILNLLSPSDGDRFMQLARDMAK